MKPNFDHVEKYRLVTHPLMSSPRGVRWGAFVIPEGNGELVVVCDDGTNPEHRTDWEHVSVHWRNGRNMTTPNWPAMCRIKDLFWDEEETVIQFHPPKSEYVNQHPHVLHLWKPLNQELPQPPAELVGQKKS